MATSSAPSPDGSPFFGLNFNGLPDDCLLEVFKYLSFKEKIRYQRVDNKWGDLLEYIWTKQTVLTYEGRPKERRSFCRITGHSYDGYFDGLPIVNMSHEKQCDILDKLTRKCHRIEAVFWFTLSKEHQTREFLNCLSNCTRLEHLSLEGINLLHLVPFVEKGFFKNIKCLALEVNQRTGAIVQLLFKSMPRLEALHIIVYYCGVSKKAFTLDMVNTLTKVLPQLSDFSIDFGYTSLGSSLLETIARLGMNIQLLAYLNYQKHDFAPETEGNLLQLLVEKMPKLESINFTGNPENFIRLLSVERLKTIHWTSSLRTKCFNMSPSMCLKNLCLSEEENRHEMLKIPQYFPNLEVLNIIPIYNMRISFPDDYFSGLKYLKRLKITFRCLSDACIQSMLENCPKLKEVSLFECISLSPRIITLFANYALLHPKRRITLEGKEPKAFVETIGFLENLKISWRGPEKIRILR